MVGKDSLMKLIQSWFQRQFADPQVVILAVFLLVGFCIVFFLGGILMPALASVVIAYLLEGLVGKLQRCKVPRLASVLLVFTLFMAFLIFVLFGLLPMLTGQIGEFLQKLPDMIMIGQQELMRLPERYPEAVSEKQIRDVMSMLKNETLSYGENLLTWSLASARSLVAVLVYLILMPLLVFFFLKDKNKLVNWVRGFLPENRTLVAHVWIDVDRQIGNYIRGKVWEILIVWVATLWTFTLLDLDFAMLLSLFVGLSVLVPYIGATVMTIPVAVVGYFQFGGTSEFAYVVMAYAVIQLLDGNLLAPLLLSEVVNMHPVAIIVAVLVFGGLWGFWGVFFAIPLATLVQSVLKAWPRSSDVKHSRDGTDPPMPSPA